MQTPIVWRKDIFTAEGISQLSQTPKYIKIKFVNEQVNGLKEGDILEIISAYSEPCIRCKFFSKDGSIQHILGQKEINIPQCYPDYILALPTDHWFYNVGSLARHSPRKVRSSLSNNYSLNRLPFFRKNALQAKCGKNEMLALEGADKTVCLPMELDMEFIEAFDNESHWLVDFMNDLLCPQYVKFLNLNLAQQIFQIDISDIFAEIEFCFDQHLFICEKRKTLDIAHESDIAGENVQWAFPSMYINDGLYNLTFYISEEFTDLQSCNNLPKAECKTAVEMVNTVKNFKQTKEPRLMMIQRKFEKIFKKVSFSSLTTFRDDNDLKVSDSIFRALLPPLIAWLDDCMAYMRRQPRSPNLSKLIDMSTKWSTEKYNLAKVMKMSPLPMYMKVCTDSESGCKSDEFLFKKNYICKIIGIHKDICVKAKYSNKSVSMNVPLSYPYLIFDMANANGENLAHENNDYKALVSLKSLFDGADSERKKQIQIMVKENDTNSVLNCLHHSSNELELEKTFDQQYVTLKVFQGMNSATVVLPTIAQSKLKFLISDKSITNINASYFQTMPVKEAIKTAASNFPIAVDFYDFEFLEGLSPKSLSDYLTESHIAQTSEEN